MILVELYFLAVRFQVRKCFCSNPWQIPNLYVWILWMIEGHGLKSSLNNANFGSTNIIISKPRKGTGVLICYGSFYRCFFVKLSHRLFSENLGFRNQLKFDEKKTNKKSNPRSHGFLLFTFFGKCKHVLVNSSLLIMRKHWRVSTFEQCTRGIRAFRGTDKYSNAIHFKSYQVLLV